MTLHISRHTGRPTSHHHVPYCHPAPRHLNRFPRPVIHSHIGHHYNPRVVTHISGPVSFLGSALSLAIIGLIVGILGVASFNPVAAAVGFGTMGIGIFLSLAAGALYACE